MILEKGNARGLKILGGLGVSKNWWRSGRGEGMEKGTGGLNFRCCVAVRVCELVGWGVGGGEGLGSWWW